jgi:hypothetical protein
MTSIARFVRTVAVAIAAVVYATADARAQVTVDFSAEVPVASPTGGGVRNLAFGTIAITPGAAQVITVPAAVGAQSGSVFSGEFAFGVGSSHGLDFTLSLPTSLISTLGGVPLNISFNGTQFGGQCVVEGSSGCTLTTFNPAATPSVTVCKSYKGNGNCKTNTTWLPGSELHVFLGGAISVPPDQVAATYTATVTLQITQVY